MGYWIYTGLRNLGASPLAGMLGLTLSAIAVTGVPAAVYGVAAALARRLPPARGSVLFAVAVASIDWARGVPHLALPWSLLGHTMAPALGVAQLAVVGGVPIVSGLLAGTGYAIAEALLSRRGEAARTAWLPWAGGLTLLLLLGLPIAQAVRGGPPEPPTARRVLAIQPRIPPGDRWMASEQQTNVVLLGRRTVEAIGSSTPGPDLVVWPETTVTVPLDQAPEVAAELARWIRRFGSPLVVGGVAAAGDASLYRNSALWLDASGRIVDRFDKTLAVPFVERAPTTRLESALRRLIGAGSVQRLAVEGDVQRSLRGDDAYAIAFCFEVIFPTLVSSRLEADSLAIINLANDAWYGSATPGHQQLAFARFRAIENRRHLIRVADSGPSAVVDPFGRIVRELGPREIGTLDALITPSSGPTSIERIAILGVALAGAGLVWIVQRRSKP
jgi:apolipoprotein N-acyltransferase